MDLSAANFAPACENEQIDFPLDLSLKVEEPNNRTNPYYQPTIIQSINEEYSCDNVLDLRLTKNFSTTTNTSESEETTNNYVQENQEQKPVASQAISSEHELESLHKEASLLLDHSLIIDDESPTSVRNGDANDSPVKNEKVLKQLAGLEKAPAIENFLFGQGYSSFEIIHRVSFWETCNHCSMYGKDHFHCLDEMCENLKLVRKDEVIRHLNYHRKKQTCMQRGFLRFSIHESCASIQPNCTHKGRNTHYHCMHPNCTKVILNTTDIEIHRKHHLRDELIENEGFLRFSASQNCNTPHCLFVKDRTTHFHCARSDCRVTFKEKCGIEKHKSFHAKNDEYISMGFIKHLKDVSCSEPDCIYSSKLNHFHCLTPDCRFSSHSTSQMVSHQKRHEKMRIINSLKKDFNLSPKKSSSFATSSSKSSKNFSSAYHSKLIVCKPLPKSTPKSSSLPSSESTPINGPIPSDIETETSVTRGILTKDSFDEKLEEVLSPQAPFEGFELRLPGNCPEQFCSFQVSTHWHCAVESCGFSDMDTSSLNEHGRLHSEFEEKLRACFEDCERLICADSDDKDLHSHCQVMTKEGSLCDATVQATFPEMVSHYVTHVPNTQQSNAFSCTCVFNAVDHFHCTNDSCAYVTLSVIDAEQHAAKCEHHAKTSASKMETSLLASESAAEDYPEAKKQRMTCPECNDESGSISGSGYLSETSSTRKVSSAVDWDKLRYSSEGEEEDDYLNSCATNGVSGGSIAIVSQEELSKQSAVVMKQKQEDKTVADDSLFVCVKISQKCPFEGCEIVRRRHYHCKVDNCTFTTNNVRTFPAHHRKHQSSQQKCQQGYMHFSQKVDCQKSSCIFRRKCAHFHCIRPGCVFSFSTANQMEPHSRKHLRKEMRINSSKQQDSGLLIGDNCNVQRDKEESEKSNSPQNYKSE